MTDETEPRPPTMRSIPMASLSPQDRARYDSLYEAVAGLIISEAENYQIVLNVLMKVTGSYIGCCVKTEHLEDVAKVFAKDIVQEAKWYKSFEREDT